VDAFQSLGQFEMVAERSNWRFCLAFGRTRLVGCWRSVDEVVAKLTAGKLERGVPRGRGVFREAISPFREAAGVFRAPGAPAPLNGSGPPLRTTPVIGGVFEFLKPITSLGLTTAPNAGRPSKIRDLDFSLDCVPTDRGPPPI